MTIVVNYMDSVNSSVKVYREEAHILFQYNRDMVQSQSEDRINVWKEQTREFYSTLSERHVSRDTINIYSAHCELYCTSISLKDPLS